LYTFLRFRAIGTALKTLTPFRNLPTPHHNHNKTTIPKQEYSHLETLFQL
jgi:hypothetical protein